MIKIEVQGAEELKAAFTDLAHKTGDLTPIWPAIAEIFYERERALFSSEGEGQWVQLSPSYGAWKSKHHPGLPLLVLTGNLRESMTGKGSPFSVYETTPHSLSVGSSVPYAIFHQLGTSKMPARPPIIIDDATTQKMLDVVTAELGKAASDEGFEVK